MADIFIVVASGGSYDDAWHSNVCAFATQEEAELEVLRRQDMHVRLIELHKVANEARWSFLRDNVASVEEMDPVPKGPAKATKELNADYQKRMSEWRKKNVPIGERNRVRQQAMIVRSVECAREAAVAAGATDEEIALLNFDVYPYSFGYGYNSDTTFSVEQLELVSSI